jgi:hypothetical protein
MPNLPGKHKALRRDVTALKDSLTPTRDRLDLSDRLPIL